MLGFTVFVGITPPVLFSTSPQKKRSDPTKHWPADTSFISKGTDSWYRTWSPWGTNPRIGWYVSSWSLPQLHSHPSVPRLLGRRQAFGRLIIWVYWHSILMDTYVIVCKWMEMIVNVYIYTSIGFDNISDCKKYFTYSRRNKHYEFKKELPMSDLQPGFHDTSCSRPCICRGEDHISPSWKLARRRTWWSLPRKAAHDMPSLLRWLVHRRSTWSECVGTAPNSFGTLSNKRCDGEIRKTRAGSTKNDPRNSVMSTFNAPSKPGLRKQYLPGNHNYMVSSNSAQNHMKLQKSSLKVFKTNPRMLYNMF